MVYFKVPWGGVQHFPGGGGGREGSMETYRTCDFPGGVQTPCPLLWVHAWLDIFKSLQKIFFHGSKQYITLIRLLPLEQSDLGPFCLQYRLPKNIGR